MPEGESYWVDAQEQTEHLSTIDVLAAYEEAFGISPQSPNSMPLPEEKNDKTEMFEGIYDHLTALALFYKAAGTTLVCNGQTFATAVVMDSEDQPQYVIFDSHGAISLNASPNSFIYTTKNREEAAHYLSYLIKYETTTIMAEDLSEEERKMIESDYTGHNRNEVAFAFQISQE